MSIGMAAWADQGYFGYLGDEWWSGGPDPGPVIPEPDPVHIQLPDVTATEGPELTPGEIAVLNDPAGRTGFEMPDTWPSDLSAAVSHSTSDVLRSLPYAISQYDEDTLVAAAQAAIHEAAVTGEPVGDTLGKWASSLSDTVRSLLPQIINRVLGMHKQPVGGAVRSPAAPASSGFNATPWVVGGLGVLALVSMTRRRAPARRRATTRPRRAPARRRR